MKAKNAPARIRLFVLLWTAANVGARLSMDLLWSFLQSTYELYDPVVNALAMTLLPGIILALAQALLMKFALRKNRVRGWIAISLAGALTSAVVYGLTGTLFGYRPSFVLMLALHGPVTVIQAFWLRRRMKNAGLWIAAGIVGALLFALPLQNPPPNASESYLLVGLAALMQGIVSAAVMLYLWTHERGKDKRVLAENSAEQLSRLSEALTDDVPAVERESLRQRVRS